MSLKCPLSAMRMTLPCRSTLCNHIQCFDAESFLQLQEQAPQWSCPTCNKQFKFDQLVVDQYVQEILQTTSKSVEQVTIEPTGDWKSGSNTTDDFRSSTSSSKAKMPTVSSSDDLVEIQEFRPNGSKSGQSSTPQSFMKSPNLSSREASTAASTAPRSTPGKRAPDNVIDLTLDSDEDEVPQPPKKRQSFGNSLQTEPTPYALPASNQSSGGYTFGVPAYQHSFQPPSNQSPFARNFWPS